MLRAWLAAIALCVMATAVQAQRTYEGREAAALRCASMFAVTAVVLAETDQFSEVERDVLLFASVAILERHVSGTWRQKRRALDLLIERRGLEDTVKDYGRNATKCFRQFPIN